MQDYEELVEKLIARRPDEQNAELRMIQRDDFPITEHGSCGE
jgi:hypothetical protein